MRAVWIDGDMLAEETVAIGPEDRGFLLGHAAFETLRVIDGRVRRWSAHRARLKGGLEYLGVAEPVWLDAVPDAARELTETLSIPDAAARLTVTAGEGGAGLEGREGVSARVLLTVKPRPAPLASVAVAVVEGARRAGSPGERFKLSGYGDLIAARREARGLGADRAVVTGAGGALACADCANLFWIKDGRVFTPAVETGALAGVTRAALIAAAAAEDIAVETISAGPQALTGADAAFMTNAVEGVVAIHGVNGAELDAGHALIARLRRAEAG